MPARIYIHSTLLHNYLRGVCKESKYESKDLPIEIEEIGHLRVRITINNYPTTSFGVVYPAKSIATTIPLSYLRTLRDYLSCVPIQEMEIHVKDGSFVPVLNNPTPIYLPQPSPL